MPITLTDYHLEVRDAVADTIDDLGIGVKTLKVEAIDDLTRVASWPVVAVCPVGPEQDRPDFTTNLRDGIAFPVLVALFEAGQPNAAKDPTAPGVTPFRRAIHVLFHKKRLAGVPQIGYCEVADSGPIFDKNQPYFQRLSTAVVVNAVGRFPRS